MPDRLLSDLEAKTRYALIHIYIKQLLPLKFANVLVALLMVYALWNEINTLPLMVWLSMHLLAVVIELFISRSFKHQPLRFSSTGWVLCFIAPILIGGLAWGAAVPLFMDISNPTNVIIMTILLLGMLSGCLYTLSILPPLFYLFVGSVIVQYSLSLYTEQGLIIIVIASLGLALFLGWLSHQLFLITYNLLISEYKNKAYADELKLAKQAVEQASAAKTRFLASASHDLRQPLQAMPLHAETLGYRLKDPENISSIKALKRSQNSMSEMMDALLDISKMDANIVQPVLNVVNMRLVITHLVR